MQLQPAGFDAREVEHVVKDAQQRMAGLLRQLQVAPLFVPRGQRLGQLGHAHHTIQRRAQFVAHVGEEGGLGEVRVLGFLQRHF